MQTRELIVRHEPVGQPRHRVSTIGGHARMYLPSKHPVHGFKAAIRAAFGQRSSHSDGVSIVVTAWFARPKSNIWKTKPMPAYRHIKKPDADNILKAVLDALNKWAWFDDAQVCGATVEKWVCDGASSPRCEIIIRRVVE